MIMPLTSMMPMLLRAPAPGPVARTSGKWPMTVAAGVVDREALRQDGPGFVFEKTQRLIERDRRRDHTLDADGIELLKFLQLPRLGRGSQARERREWHELVAGSGDVHLRKLIGRQALRARDLRNDLIAPALDAEPVDVVAAQKDWEISSGLTQV